jgi:hypothetical protein
MSIVDLGVPLAEDADSWNPLAFENALHVQFAYRISRRSEYDHLTPIGSRDYWGDSIGTIQDVLSMDDERVLLDMKTVPGFDARNLRNMRIALGGLTNARDGRWPSDRPHFQAIPHRPGADRFVLWADTFGTPVPTYDIATVKLYERVLMRDWAQWSRDESRPVRSAPPTEQAGPEVIEVSNDALSPARFPLATVLAIGLCPIFLGLIFVALFLGSKQYFLLGGFASLSLSLLATAVLQLRAIYRSSHQMTITQYVYVD